jgi:hypothetical protein
MSDELQARMDAVRRFTVATKGEAVAKTKMEAMRTVTAAPLGVSS